MISALLGLSVYTRKLKKPSEFADWLDEFFDALALDGAINMMGMSYGGWMTAQYALRFPNRLGKIVLLAPALTVFPGKFEMTARGMLSLIPPRRFFTKKLFYWLMQDAVQASEASRLLVERIMDDMMTASKCLKRKMFVPPTVLNDEELRSITMPVLILIGEHEKLYSARDAVERLNAVAPQIKTEIIPNAGHDLPFVRAEIVNDKVLGFLNEPQ